MKKFYLNKKLLFLLLFLSTGFILISHQFIMASVHQIINHYGIFSLHNIKISGSLSPQTKKKLLKNPYLLKMQQSKRSLLSINSQNLTERLSQLVEVKDIQVNKYFPHTLELVVQENLDIIIVNTPRRQYAVNLNEEKIDPTSFNYNRFIVQLREKEDNEQELTKNFFQRLLREIKQLPQAEKDFLTLFSHLNYYRGRINLYANHHPLVITWVDSPQKKSLRKARYSLLYWEKKNLMSQGFNLIDISGRLVRYSKKTSHKNSHLAEKISAKIKS